MSKRAAKTPATSPFHAWNSNTLKTSGYGLRTVCTCLRCGANRFVEMGERMPVVCTPTPEWLRREGN